ncbi:MAG: carboxypeptidase-like regulatory domain-containing protein [Thermoproteota archaeon]
MSEVVEIKDRFLKLQQKYRQHLPKVDPALIDDLLLRQMENPNVVPIYMVEVFTRPGLNVEEVRNYIISKTGMSPAVYDNGTHYAVNQKLTLEMLKEISDSEEVIEVTGEYTGGLGSYGASHEHRPREDRYERIIVSSSVPSSSALRVDPQIKSEEQQLSRKKASSKIVAYTAAGIIGAIALAGFIISGGILPNANVSQTIPAGTEPAVLHGYVGGPGGLPAIGATVLAVRQGTDFAASAFVSVNGQYYIDLPPGEYIVYVAYPDGTDKVAAMEVQRGASHELNFAY